MRRRYDWETWQSGEVYSLPEAEARGVAGVLRTRAARTAQPVRTRRLTVRTPDGLERRLAFQFRPPDGDFAPVFGGPDAPPPAAAETCGSCGRPL